MRRLRKIAGCALLLLAVPVAAQSPDLGTEAQREEGKVLYDKYCAQCHGLAGDGEGYATPRVKPVPRDFTPGKYKFRSTPSGTLPTDADLVRVIKVGLPYTSMPGWPMFDDDQIQNIVYYIKTFSPAFEEPDKYGDPIDIPAPLPSSEESIAKGREVYLAQGCAACHGDQGRGNGLSAPTMLDDWGNHLRPADMTMRWTFRGGATKQDIFRTFSTGLNGTPMPSYYETVEDDDRWHLVNYIVSLGESDEPNYQNLIRVLGVEDEIDLQGDTDALFADAPTSRIALVGQIVEPGRNFYPSATSVLVQSVYNRREIAFRLRWNDMRAETSGKNRPDTVVPDWDGQLAEIGAGKKTDDEDEGGFWGEEIEEDGGDDFWGEEVEEDGDDFWGEEEDDAGPSGPEFEFNDAVAIQLPVTLPTGNPKPYFVFGDGTRPVDLWFADLAESRVRQYKGRGSDALEAVEEDLFEIASSYDDGEWTVIMKREIKSRSGIAFEPEVFVPVAFSVWDGFNRERGNKRALSVWSHLYLEPMERVSATGPMIKAALLALIAELAAVFWIRRRFAAGIPEPAEDQDSSGTVPQGGLAK